MRKIRLFILMAVATLAFAAAPDAAAEFRFGIQGGINVGEFHFDSSTFDGNNRVGFNFGVLGEFTMPATGLGVDLGIRYVRRNSRWEEQYASDNEFHKSNRDYFEIPLNFKWRISIPVISSFVRPYLATGPSFSFLTSRTLGDTYRNRKFDTAWNFGFGVELMRHVVVGASYGIGLTKALKTFNMTNSANIDAKNRYWTVTAAYMF